MCCLEGHVLVHYDIYFSCKPRSRVIDPDGVDLPDFGTMSYSYICYKLLDLMWAVTIIRRRNSFVAVRSQIMSTRKERMIAPIGSIPPSLFTAKSWLRIHSHHPALCKIRTMGYSGLFELYIE